MNCASACSCVWVSVTVCMSLHVCACPCSATCLSLLPGDPACGCLSRCLRVAGSLSTNLARVRVCAGPSLTPVRCSVSLRRPALVLDAVCWPHSFVHLSVGLSFPVCECVCVCCVSTQGAKLLQIPLMRVPREELSGEFGGCWLH